jgi:hypothetical protein
MIRLHFKELQPLALGLVLGLGLPTFTWAFTWVAPSCAEPFAPDSVPDASGIVAVGIEPATPRDGQAATVYIHNATTHELVPQTMAVDSQGPVAAAVGEIMRSYQGQDIGIQGYQVTVDGNTHQATISFDIDNPRGAEAF